MTDKTNNMPGIVLDDKRIKLISKRLKKEIISISFNNKFVGKKIYLCGSKVCGIITLNEPQIISKAQFKNRNKRHFINEKERESMWPDNDKFYAYGFRINKMFKNKEKYINDNTGSCFIDEVNIINNVEKPKLTDKDKFDKYIDSVDLEKSIDLKEYYFDKYFCELDRLKALNISGKYKEVSLAILCLYELYLERMIEKKEKNRYDKNGVVLKPEPDITENYIRIRIRNPKTMVEGSFRTIFISKPKGIKAVIGKLKSDPKGSTKIQSVLFEKDKWTVAAAQTWVRNNMKNLKVFSSDNPVTFINKNNRSNKVIIKEKICVEEVWICPHCKSEIYEKSLYFDNNTKEWFHRPCLSKGPIELPRN